MGLYFCVGHEILDMENFVGHVILVMGIFEHGNFGHGNFFFGHVMMGHANVGSNFFLQNHKSRGSLQMLKGIWEILSPDIKNIINEAGFQTFFQALLNQETHEYKDL